MIRPVVAALWVVLWLAAAALAFGAQALAQQFPETRLALVIAQTNYSGELSKITQAQSEAKLVGDALTATGFRVSLVRDLTREQLGRALDNFRLSLERAGPNAVGFVYYTGHGLQHPQSGDSYLLGIDTRLQGMSDLARYGLDMQSQRDGFAATGAKAVFLVFDACRNAPSIPGFKANVKGLNRVEASADMFIAFSTSLNAVAEEGVYAPILAEELVRPGLSAEAAFASVQRRVAQKTGRRQLPWTNNLLYNSICFAGCGVDTAQASAPALPPNRPPDAEELSPPKAESDLALAQLNQLLGKPVPVVRFPGVGVVRNSGAVFVHDSSQTRRTLPVGAGLELLGYSADQKAFRVKHAEYGTGLISVSDVAVQ